MSKIEEIDWSKAKIQAWSGKYFNTGEPVILDIEKETNKFIWVTFKGRRCKIHKGNFIFGTHSYLQSYLAYPRMEFGLIEDYVEPVPPKEECDKCKVQLPCDAGFKVEATCLENNDPDDDFEAHLCHECFGRIEGDVFK